MKTLRSKLTVVFAFFAVVALAFGIGFMPKQASAAVDISTGFYIEDGASIRTEVGESGIKWTAHITESKYAELNAPNQIDAIGIAIGPQGRTDLEIHYVYGSENYKITFNEKGEFVYSYAIYYDQIIKDYEDIYKVDLDETQEKAKLLEAFQTILEARPFVRYENGTDGEGNVKYVYSYGEDFDTARSLQGVALGNLVAGTYADYSIEGNEATENLLKSYLPNGYELADTEYVADSYYSNYDAWGNIAIDSAIPMANARVYYGAKDVTSAYNKDTGILALTKDNKVETKITTDGSANDFITIYDQSTGKVYKQYFIGVTLAIDKATDLAYFRLNKQVIDNLVPAEGDGVFDGYYVLLNNVTDATYFHQFANNSGFNNITFDNVKAQTAEGGLLEGKYFTGVFDGRGYTISEICFPDNGGGSLNSGGLFGVINGGVIKNVAFNNINKTYYWVNGRGPNSSGVLAKYIVNGARIEDVYINYSGVLNNGGSSGVICSAIESDCILNRILVNWSNSNKNIASGGGLFGRSFDEANVALKDVYVISNVPLFYGENVRGSIWNKETKEFISAYSLAKVAADAAYVDDDPNVTTTTNYYQAWKFENAYSTEEFDILLGGSGVHTADTKEGNGITKVSAYDYSILEGVKRYTSVDMMNTNKALANNDFSNWPGVWTIVDGAPYFTSQYTTLSTYTATLNGSACNETSNLVERGEVNEVNILRSGALQVNKPSLEVVSGKDIVTVEGNTFTGIASGDAVIKVVFGPVSHLIPVTIINPTIVNEYEYQFSAADGLFFDGANVVSVADVLGVTDKVVKAYDADGKPLTVTEDGAILGFETSAKDWLSTYVYLYTENADCYKVYVELAELIIDEATDLDYFSLTNPVTTRVIPAEGEAEWDGYYVLAKNIDASSYTHQFAGTSGFIGSDGTIDAVISNVPEDKYLTGTFDGQGYTISKLKYTADSTAIYGGLFGIINGGTVKNVAFTDSQMMGPGYSGFFASWIINDAVISDVFLYVEGSRNVGAEHGLIARGVHNSTTLERVVVRWYSTKNMPISSGVLVDGNFTSEFINANISDCYFIADIPVAITDSSSDFGDPDYTNSTAVNKTTGNTDVTGRFSMVYADALYVDDVENTTSTAKTFHKAWGLADGSAYSTDKYTVTINGTSYSEPYTIKTIKGLKRYTTIDMMNTATALANNDFSNWPGVWTIINGVPKFTANENLSTYTATLNGRAYSETDNIVALGDVNRVNILRDSVLQVNKPSLEVVSGAEFVTINGNTFTGIAGGDAVIKVVFGPVSFLIPVTVDPSQIVYEHEYQFSAHDGVIFNGSEVVALDSIIGDGEGLTKVTDKDGNELTLSDGKILGITTSTKNWEDNKLYFYLDDCVLIVNVKVAELIIDEKEDFAYFTLKHDWDYGKTQNFTYTFHADDFEWHGYYVLAKNIDATGYSHNLGSGLGKYSNGVTVTCFDDLGYANRLDWTGGFKNNTKGFKGVFDGQGYAISNLTTNRFGLLGMIFGGKIQNLGMINCNNGATYYAPLAWGIANGSSIENVYVEMPTRDNFAGGEYAPLVSSWTYSVCDVKNFVVVDNNTYPNAAAGLSYIGSLTTDTTRGDSVYTEPTTFGTQAGVLKPYNNVILVSPIPMSVSVSQGAMLSSGTTRMDAEYIDGVLNENTYTITNRREGEGGSTVSKPVQGVRRYSNQGALYNDLANITAQLKQLTSTGLFTVSADGVIGWAKVSVSSSHNFTVGTNYCEDCKAYIADSAETLQASMNAIATATDTVVIEIEKDIDLSTFAYAQPSPNAKTIVINGNENTISGMTVSLFGVITKSNITVNDLYIDGAVITGEATMDDYAGVFGVDASSISGSNYAFDNVHVKATVTSKKYAGGFIGYIGNDQSSSSATATNNATITNCSFEGTITGGGSVGAVVGHNYANLTVTGFEVKAGSTIECTEDRGTSARKAGAIVGTCQGPVVVSGIVNNGTVVNVNGKANDDNTDLYGRIAAPGSWTALA